MGLSRVASAIRRHFSVPDVIVDVVCEDDILFACLQNIGDGPAHHISVAFDPEVPVLRDTTHLSDLSLFQHLSFLPPGKEIRTPMSPVRDYFDREAPIQFTTEIRFQTDSGDALSRSIDHDLRIYDVTTQTYHH